jgi:hypothetical protein
MFCWSDGILQNILHIQSGCEEYSVGLTVNCGIFLRILSVPQNTIMALKNVMNLFTAS